MNEEMKKDVEDYQELLRQQYLSDERVLVVKMFVKNVVMKDQTMNLIERDIEFIEVVDNEIYTEYIYTKDKQNVVVVVGLIHQMIEVHVLEEIYNEQDEYIDSKKKLIKLYYLDKEDELYIYI